MKTKRLIAGALCFLIASLEVNNVQGKASVNKTTCRMCGPAHPAPTYSKPVSGIAVDQ